MKLKLLVVILLASCVHQAIAQDRYVVFFSDKNNSPFTTSSPLDFLSQRAIDRRNNQNITIDQSDLPVNPQYLSGVAGTGATVKRASKWFNAAIIETTNPSVLAAISQLPYVLNVQNVSKPQPNPDRTNKFDNLVSTVKPSKQALRLQGNQSLNYGNSFDQTNMLGLVSLHNQGYTGAGKLIAVLDAGFLDANLMSCFDSIRTHNQIKYTWDFVDNEVNVYNDHNHGSSVLSCMAANVPDTLIGTAPHADYILLRTEDANSEYIIEEYNWAIGAEFADSAGADMINSSLGYTEFNDPSQNHFYADMNGDSNPVTIAADWAAQKGILVINSAGNEGGSPWNYISAPADADSILAVGAVDFSGAYAGFSGNGPSYDNRIKPDVAAQGQNTWLYSPFSGNQPTQGNGTSFSGPVMCGAVACLWQAWSQKSNMDIIQVVKRSAHQYSIPDTLLGYGIPNFALANSLLGLGDINVPQNSLLHVFPNPVASGEIIQLIYFAQNSSQASLSIHDVCGKIVLKQELNTILGTLNKINLTVNLSKGCYIIVINDGKEIAFKKLIAQ
ncbi:MAG: S8 family serine peptidase [Bacteroidetes bacterium]|nr:S8 family serine peptidase [Bacteroidota bacterium]